MNIEGNEPVYVPRKIPVKESYWIEDLVKNADTKQRQKQVQPRRKLYSRKMLDSYMEEFLPFKSNPEVLEEYIDPHGGIRYIYIRAWTRTHVTRVDSSRTRTRVRNFLTRVRTGITWLIVPAEP